MDLVLAYMLYYVQGRSFNNSTVTRRKGNLEIKGEIEMEKIGIESQKVDVEGKKMEIKGEIEMEKVGIEGKKEGGHRKRRDRKREKVEVERGSGFCN